MRRAWHARGIPDCQAETDLVSRLSCAASSGGKGLTVLSGPAIEVDLDDVDPADTPESALELPSAIARHTFAHPARVERASSTRPLCEEGLAMAGSGSKGKTHRLGHWPVRVL